MQDRCVAGEGLPIVTFSIARRRRGHRPSEISRSPPFAHVGRPFLGLDTFGDVGRGLGLLHGAQHDSCHFAGSGEPQQMDYRQHYAIRGSKAIGNGFHGVRFDGQSPTARSDARRCPSSELERPNGPSAKSHLLFARWHRNRSDRPRRNSIFLGRSPVAGFERVWPSCGPTLNLSAGL